VSGPHFRVFRRAQILLLVLSLAGCDEVFQSRSARSMERAEKREADGDFQGAIAFYENALDGTARTAEVHYRLALLYGDKLKDRVAALHHFQRYLELAPSAAHAKEAKAFVKEAESTLLNSSTEGALSQQDAANLKNENLRLVRQLTELHAQLADLRAQARGMPVKGADAPEPIAAGSRTYVVQPGDTLASIARRLYKNSSRWKDIEDANYNRLGHTTKLKPGMTLVIP